MRPSGLRPADHGPPGDPQALSDAGLGNSLFQKFVGQDNLGYLLHLPSF
jgi:hypothetical protein